LDRQHPRDLFDIHYLLENEGISEKLKNSFIVYLLSHPRPMAELLAPRMKDIKTLYQKEFLGMSVEVVSVEKLLRTRVDLIRELHGKLTDDDKNFLLSVKSNQPKWELFAYPEAKNLPAIKWKLYNLSKMSKLKRKTSLTKLEKILINKNSL
jgi:hypothetical protein